MKRIALLLLLLVALSACEKAQESTPAPAATPAPLQPATPAEPQTAPPAESQAAPAQDPATAAQPAPVEPAPRTQTPPAAPSPSASAPPVQDAEDILALARKSGCMACHDMDAQRMGPSWKSIAVKYRAQPDARKMLLESVRNGSKGKWPEAKVAMPAYKDKVAEPDILKLVEYILTL